jgi:putative transposase
MVLHVLNRANGRRRLFHSDADYEAFVRVLVEALEREPGLELFAFCVMPNHWHLVVRPRHDGQLSRFMRWLGQTHTQRWRHARRRVGEGALYQGRFKSFPVKQDRHFLVLCRYVERNAVRAKLAGRAEYWRWGSAAIRAGRGPIQAVELSEWPIERPTDWSRLLAEPETEAERDALLVSLRRNRPFGDDTWTRRAAARLGLGHTLRPPGRPPKRNTGPRPDQRRFEADSLG